LTARKRNRARTEANFVRTPIDLPTVRDAARRELRASGATIADDLPAAVLEQLTAKVSPVSPLLFFAVRSVDKPLSASAERRIELPLAAGIEANFHPEVEDFCRKFFETEPDNRRAGWMVLRRLTAASPALTARLEELSRGLDVDRRTLADQKPAVQRLAGLMRESFLLPPPERAVRRREWFAGHKKEAKALRPAGWRLRWSFRQTAQLDPVFMQTIRSPAPPRRWWSEIKITPETRKLNRVDTFVHGHPKTCVLTAVLIVGTVVACAIMNDQPGSHTYPARSRFGPQEPRVIYRMPPQRPSATAKLQKPAPTNRPTPKKTAPKKPGTGM
jgi:hypothetical protein